MKKRTVVQIGAGLLLSVFMSCGDGPSSSTEVENELQLARIDGVAATGEAIVGAQVVFLAQDGIVLGSDTTDSVGHYEIDLAVDMDSLPLYMIQVYGQDTLSSLIPNEKVTDSLWRIHRHTNPLTNRLSTRIRDELGDSILSVESLDVRGRDWIQSLLGQTVAWGSFASDSLFSPWVPGGTHPPSTSDAMLHSLGDRARVDGLSLDSFLVQHEAQSAPLLEDKDFQQELVKNMVVMGVDSLEGDQRLNEWMNGMEEKEDVLFDYHELHRIRDKGSGGLSSNLSAFVFGAVDSTLSTMVIPTELKSYTTQIIDIAHQTSLKMLTGFEDSAWTPSLEKKLELLVRELARTSLQVLLNCTPEEHEKDVPWVVRTTEILVRDHVMFQINIHDPGGLYFQVHYAVWTDAEAQEAVQQARKMK